MEVLQSADTGLHFRAAEAGALYSLRWCTVQLQKTQSQLRY